MASVLVHIEADGDRPSPDSLALLGEGRRIATTLGAVLHAAVVVPDGDIPVQSLGRTLGEAGADRVMLLRQPAAAGPAAWLGHGAALRRGCELASPILVLLAADQLGRALGPRLAAALRAAWVAEPVIEYGPRGEVVLVRATHGLTHRRRLAVEDLDEPVVAVVPARLCRPALGTDVAEVSVVDVAPPAAGLEYAGVHDDPGAELETARVIVLAGAGVASFETWSMVQRLAEVLGAEVAATRALCDAGIAPAEREVGVGARRIDPELLVVCGASGSSASLGALAGDAEIIAVDRNPDAPIFKLAHYGLVGELDVVLPDLIEALRGRAKAAVP
ncbi:MAG TPA: FAD-binding protein [Kofleriaceae bacterium]|nr:FAD-binding protein [Kofleriaceae bacterium]